MNIRDTATNFVAPETKNIVDLDKVSVDMDIEVKTFQDGDGKDFNVNVITVKDEEYRVPTSVIKQLKVILEKKPDMEFFSVGKSGTGLGTTYTVIPQ